MFRDLIRQSEIAERHGLSLQRVRELASGHATEDVFPPCERMVGNVKFYAKHAVDCYFESRVDQRQFNGRKWRKR